MSKREGARESVAEIQDPLRALALQDPLQNIEVDTPEERRRQLALKGSWRALADATSANAQGEPDWLQIAAWHILSQTKLRNFSGALERLAALGELSRLETSTSQGEAVTVPFILHILACELPARLGRWRESQDAYYALLELCTSRIGEFEISTEPSSEHCALWQHRQERVVASLFSQHLRLKEYDAALQWLAWLCQRHPDSLELQSTVGCVQLTIGHAHAAAATFKAISEHVDRTLNSSTQDKLLVRRNRGLLLFAENDFEGAAAEFDAIAATKTQDPLAANNRAIAQMYAGNIAAALQSLEGSLRDNPLPMLVEPIIANLGCMYELCAPAVSQASKRNLGAWVARVAPDDFELSWSL